MPKHLTPSPSSWLSIWSSVRGWSYQELSSPWETWVPWPTLSPNSLNVKNEQRMAHPTMLQGQLWEESEQFNSAGTSSWKKKYSHGKRGFPALFLPSAFALAQGRQDPARLPLRTFYLYLQLSWQHETPAGITLGKRNENNLVEKITDYPSSNRCCWLIASTIHSSPPSAQAGQN